MKNFIGEKLSAVFSSIRALCVAWITPPMVMMSSYAMRLSTAIQRMLGLGTVKNIAHSIECHVIVAKATDVVKGRTNISQKKIANEYLELAKKSVCKECGFTIEYLQGKNEAWTSLNTQRLLRNRVNERRNPRTPRYFPRHKRESCSSHGSVVDIFGTRIN